MPGPRRVGRVPQHDADGPAAAPGALRLNKALSQAGLGSRRAVEALVVTGRVSIDGEVVLDLGRRVDPASQQLTVDGSRVVLDPELRYWLLNKPSGTVTTSDDPQGRPTVLELVPATPRVYPVGRLDQDTEGLLLLTNDGELTHRLTHPSFGVPKRYLAEVSTVPPGLVARLRRGVMLDDGPARPADARVVSQGGRGRSMVEIVMLEGRKREVRRLLDAAGAPVRRLVRTELGPLRLTGLAPGAHRALTREEVRALYRSAGL